MQQVRWSRTLLAGTLRAEGKRHNQAIIALARRGSDVLFAMLRDSTLYQDPKPAPIATAA
jgi:hypothetical protein